MVSDLTCFLQSRIHQRPQTSRVTTAKPSAWLSAFLLDSCAHAWMLRVADSVLLFCSALGLGVYCYRKRSSNYRSMSMNQDPNIGWAPAVDTHDYYSATEND